ncbi:hypothetical protein DFH09DRAFT_1459341 [Mycena vulgaris]|nr:hypothetical protein DFH09DRAFT_1459341 [Mycena vulgaris]
MGANGAVQAQHLIASLYPPGGTLVRPVGGVYCALSDAGHGSGTRAERGTGVGSSTVSVCAAKRARVNSAQRIRATTAVPLPAVCRARKNIRESAFAVRARLAARVRAQGAFPASRYTHAPASSFRRTASRRIGSPRPEAPVSSTTHLGPRLRRHGARLQWRKPSRHCHRPGGGSRLRKVKPQAENTCKEKEFKFPWRGKGKARAELAANALPRMETRDITASSTQFLPATTGSHQKPVNPDPYNFARSSTAPEPSRWPSTACTLFFLAINYPRLSTRPFAIYPPPAAHRTGRTGWSLHGANDRANLAASAPVKELTAAGTPLCGESVLFRGLAGSNATRDIGPAHISSLVCVRSERGGGEEISREDRRRCTSPCFNNAERPRRRVNSCASLIRACTMARVTPRLEQGTHRPRLPTTAARMFILRHHLFTPYPTGYLLRPVRSPTKRAVTASLTARIELRCRGDVLRVDYESRGAPVLRTVDASAVINLGGMERAVCAQRLCACNFHAILTPVYGAHLPRVHLATFLAPSPAALLIIPYGLSLSSPAGDHAADRRSAQSARLRRQRQYGRAFSDQRRKRAPARAGGEASCSPGATGVWRRWTSAASDARGRGARGRKPGCNERGERGGCASRSAGIAAARAARRWINYESDARATFGRGVVKVLPSFVNPFALVPLKPSSVLFKNAGENVELLGEFDLQLSFELGTRGKPTLDYERKLGIHNAHQIQHVVLNLGEFGSTFFKLNYVGNIQSWVNVLEHYLITRIFKVAYGRLYPYVFAELSQTRNLLLLIPWSRVNPTSDYSQKLR